MCSSVYVVCVCVCVRVHVCTPLVITACAASVVVQYWTLAAVGTSCYMNPKNAIWLLSMDLIHMYATVCSGDHAYLPYWVSLTVNVWWLCVYCYLCSTTSMCLHFVLDRLHHVICMHYIDTAFIAFWHCWLGVRKSIRPVKIEWWSVGVVICLELGADCFHMIQLMPLPSPSSPTSFKSRLVLPLWLSWKRDY